MRPYLRLAIIFIAITLSAPARATEFRSINGENNNEIRPNWGAAGTPYIRKVPTRYVDGLGQPDPALPNPRIVSNAIFHQHTNLPDPRGISDWGWAWGQFVDHDITHAPSGSQFGRLTIEIPPEDPVFGDLRPNNQISLNRTNFEPDSGSTSPRLHVNTISAYLDASMVYGGSHEEGEEEEINRAEWLRTMDGTGRFRVSDGGPLGDLLPPFAPGQSPAMANTFFPTMQGTAFVAGDVRANENLSLTSIHTLFVREHNRLAVLIRTALPDASGEEIFQRARKIVACQIQAITYNQYLPALGVHLPPYQGYDRSVNPQIAHEFATAGFRMGHSQINDQLLRLGNDGRPIGEGHIPLAEAFFSPGKLGEGGLEPILRGLSSQTQQQTDARIVDGLRNQLFTIFIPGKGPVDNATDLAAINMLRGRDHGIGTFNEIRQAYGLQPLTRFSQITADEDLAHALDRLYDGQIDKVEPFVGALAQDNAPGASLSPTTIAMLKDQFGRLRDGDRFFFQNGHDRENADLTLVSQWNGQSRDSAIAWLNRLTLTDIIELNTSINGLQEDVFRSRPWPNYQLDLATNLAGGQTTVVQPDQTLTLTLTLTNTGNSNLEGIRLEQPVPNGFSVFNSPGWTVSGDRAFYEVITAITPGSGQDIPLQLLVTEAATGSSTIAQASASLITPLPGSVQSDLVQPEGVPEPVEVTVTPGPWDGWALATENPAGNEDGDHLKNILEYALGTQPRVGDSLPMEIRHEPDGSIGFRFQRKLGIEGIDLLLEASNDLRNPDAWTSIEPGRVEREDQGNGNEWLTWWGLENSQATSPANGVIRLRVNLGRLTATSPLLGWQLTDLQPGYTTLSNPYSKSPVLGGRIQSANPTSLRLNASSPIPEAIREATTSFYVELLDGDLAGRRLTIDHFPASDRVELSPSTPLPVYSDLSGARFALIPHWTLDELFAPIEFTGSNDPTEADQIHLFENGQFRTLFLLRVDTMNLLQWIDENDNGTASGAFTNMGNQVLEPGSAVFANLRGARRRQLIHGLIRENPFRSERAEGYSLLGSPWPITHSPTERGLGPETGFTAHNDPTRADQIQMWAGDSRIGDASYEGYFLLSLGDESFWTANSSADLQNQNTQRLFAPNRGFFLRLNQAEDMVSPVPWTKE
ncbi:MAG: peroxidase family protein [Verrucomicrobiota bacterium]